MARRKRLTPPTAAPAPEAPALRSPVSAPVSRVAGEAAAAAALEELAGEMTRAREEGRMVLPLPLTAIEAGHLVRDRLTPEDEELDALVESLRARGQQTPIEVVALAGGRYGLISGWRRLTALGRLHAQTGEARFATALALLRRPEGAAEAYRAMVEENEIRVGLSHYERARIGARAVEQGVFPDEGAAFRTLYAAVSRPKRSKIRAFAAIYRRLDDLLRHPAAIPERLGLRLARALEESPGFADALRARLVAAGAAVQQSGAEAELAVLAAALAEGGGEAPRLPPAPPLPPAVSAEPADPVPAAALPEPVPSGPVPPETAGPGTAGFDAWGGGTPADPSPGTAVPSAVPSAAPSAVPGPARPAEPGLPAASEVAPSAAPSAVPQAGGGIHVQADLDGPAPRILLSGPGLDADFLHRLRLWLARDAGA